MVSWPLTSWKKMKTLSKNWWSLDSPNNCEKVSYKGKARSKEHNRTQSAKSSESSNNLSILDRIRLNNARRLIIGHLKINSLRNKFEMLREIARDKLDILLVSETKVDPSFPSSQSPIKCFSVPFRLDRNSSGGGIMLFVKEETPSKLLSQYKPNSSVENIFIEINLRSKKWLLSCSCNPNFTLLNNHIRNITGGLDFCLPKYDNFIVLRDFNTETSNDIISEFCATCNLKNLIKEPTCFKSLENLTCIDLILTNRPKCFQNSNVFETELSDFRKLTFIVLKAYFQK